MPLRHTIGPGNWARTVLAPAPALQKHFSGATVLCMKGDSKQQRWGSPWYFLQEAMDRTATIPLSNLSVRMPQRNFSWALGPKKMGMLLNNCTLFYGPWLLLKPYFFLCLSIQEAQNWREWSTV